MSVIVGEQKGEKILCFSSPTSKGEECPIVTCGLLSSMLL